MANTSQVPDVRETDLERSDLETAAQELGLDEVEDLDDQQLFERIGVALGEIDLDELEASTRDEVEEAVDRADEASDQAEDAAADAVDEGEDAADEAQDTAADAADEASDTAEDAADEASDTAEDASDEAQETAEDAADEGEGDADEATDRAEAGEVLDRDPEEYRFEDDPREGIEPVLDLETGPVALDLLGVEIHLRRVHAVLTANPNRKRNILGKVLAQLSQAAASGGGDEDEETEEEEPQDEESGSEDDTGDESGDDEEDEGGLLQTLTAPARGLVNGAKKLLGKD